MTYGKINEGVQNRLHFFSYEVNQAVLELGLKPIEKIKRLRNFTHDSLLATEKVVEHAYILLYIARIYLFHILL